MKQSLGSSAQDTQREIALRQIVDKYHENERRGDDFAGIPEPRYRLDAPDGPKQWSIIDQQPDCPFSVVDVYSEMPHAEQIARYALALLNS